MKKNSSITLVDRNGFIFPFVSFLASLVIIVMVTSLSIYKNQTTMTQLLEEQIRLSTLFQMATTQLNKDVSLDPNKYMQQVGQVSYEFPYGIVTINFYPYGDTSLSINYTIYTERYEEHGTTVIYIDP